MQDPEFFHKLAKGRQRHAVIAKVLRKWTIYKNQGEGGPQFVGMVLADAKGQGMYAQISEDLIDDKAYLFDIGKIYKIKKFVVDNARDSFRSVSSKLMIEITVQTSAEEITSPGRVFPDYIYRITPLRLIRTSEVITDYTDTIGYVVRYNPLKVFVPKNKEKVKMLREIFIKDESSTTMKVTLWGENAANFTVDNIYDEKAGNLVVCLLVGCIARNDFPHKDKVALTGSSACSYYLNPDIREAAALHSSYRQ